MLYHPVILSPGVKEPLCGWDWARDHQHDLDGWTPTIEFVRPRSSIKVTIKDDKVIKDIIKALK